MRPKNVGKMKIGNRDGNKEKSLSEMKIFRF